MPPQASVFFAAAAVPGAAATGTAVLVNPMTWLNQPLPRLLRGVAITLRSGLALPAAAQTVLTLPTWLPPSHLLSETPKARCEQLESRLPGQAQMQCAATRGGGATRHLGAVRNGLTDGCDALSTPATASQQQAQIRPTAPAPAPAPAPATAPAVRWARRLAACHSRQPSSAATTTA